MNQAELLGFIIERGAVSSGQVARHFNIPVPFAHQVLRRLKDKGILAIDEGSYPLVWRLSGVAQKELQGLSNGHKGYGWIFLLGLGVGLLLGFASHKKDGNQKDDHKNDSTTGSN